MAIDRREAALQACEGSTELRCASDEPVAELWLTQDRRTDVQQEPPPLFCSPPSLLLLLLTSSQPALKNQNHKTTKAVWFLLLL